MHKSTISITVLIAGALSGNLIGQERTDPGHGTSARLCRSDSPSAQTTASVTARIAQVEWLAGTWTGTAGIGTVEERWTPPAGGSMLAVARTIHNGELTGFEFLCIAERNGGLVYQAMPNGRQPATEFTLTQIGPNSVTFENPAHDFPKKIRYTLNPDGTLEAVVSGTEAQRPLTFRFTKQ